MSNTITTETTQDWIMQYPWTQEAYWEAEKLLRRHGQPDVYKEFSYTLAEYLTERHYIWDVPEEEHIRFSCLERLYREWFGSEYYDDSVRRMRELHG